MRRRTAPRRRPNPELRRRIIAAARELFLSKGYQNVSMRAVAAAIGYSPTTIYLYFKDKAQLIFEICEETFAELNAMKDTLEAVGPKDPVERLRMGMKAYIRFGISHPDHYMVSFGGVARELGDAWKYEGSLGEKSFTRFRELVAACVKARDFRKTDVDLATQALWTSMHGVTSLLITHKAFPWAPQDRLIDAVVDGVIEGMRR